MAQKAKEKPKLKYRLISGLHAGPGRASAAKHFKQGDIILSSEPLSERFPNKFELVDETPRPPPVAAKPEIEEAKPETESPPTPPSELDKTDSLGENVTAKFKKAVEGGLLIFKTEDGKYNVCDKDVPDVALNAEPLGKKDLEKLVDSFTKREEE